MTRKSLGIAHIIYENELNFVFNDNDVGLCQCIRGKNEIIWNPSIEQRYGVRPILYIYNVPPRIQETLLPKRKSSDFGSTYDLLTAAEIALSVDALPVDQFHDLIYIFGSLEHHLKNLVKEYSKIANNFAKAKDKHEGEENGETSAIIHPYTVLYEFDAFITAAIRCYETLRIILWSNWENTGTRPRSFEKLLKSKNEIPKKFLDILSVSWKNFGEKADYYRDFIQHYYNLTASGLPIPKVKNLGDNIWGVFIYLPDNPEKKSRQKFTFDEEIDALQYAWSLADEIASLYIGLTKHLPRKKR